MLRLFGVIDDQLGFPFDLVYESPNLSTIKLIRAGENPYSPDIYADRPFIITLYTPLYHYAAAIFPVSGENPFFFGRIVSMTAMFLAALALFFVNRRNSIRLLPVIAAGVFFSFRPVISNTAFLKNDPMALFFSALAVVLIHSSRSKSRIMFSAFFCVLALATKQSYISAAMVCLLYAFFSNRGRFLWFLFFMALFSTGFILIASFLWGDGFWFSTVYALRQGITCDQALLLFRHIFKQPLAWFLTGLSLASTAVVLKQRRLRVFAESPYLFYVLTSLFVLITTAGKQGASTNYFFESLGVVFPAACGVICMCERLHT